MPTISTNSNKAGQDIDKEQIDKFNDHYSKCKDVYIKNEEKSEDGLDIKAIQTRNNLPVDDGSSPKKGSKGKEPKLKKQDTYKRQRSDYLIMRKDSKVVLPTKRKKSKK